MSSIGLNLGQWHPFANDCWILVPISTCENVKQLWCRQKRIWHNALSILVLLAALVFFWRRRPIFPPYNCIGEFDRYSNAFHSKSARYHADLRIPINKKRSTFRICPNNNLVDCAWSGLIMVFEFSTIFSWLSMILWCLIYNFCCLWSSCECTPQECYWIEFGAVSWESGVGSATVRPQETAQITPFLASMYRGIIKDDYMTTVEILFCQ